MTDPHPRPAPPPPDVRIVRFAEVDSTSAHARREAHAGRLGPGPVAFIAGRQTAGVGRFGRAWASPAGGLWLTLARPVPADDYRDKLRGLGLRVGVACLRTIRAIDQDPAWAQRVRLKWPNDVLVDGRKVLGALTEVGARPGGAAWVLVGVGVNADFQPDDLPGPLRNSATTLRAALGRPIDLDALEASLLCELPAAIGQSGVPAATMREAAAALHGVGERVAFSGPDGAKRDGVLVGLDADGLAIVEVEGVRRTAPLGSVLMFDVPTA